MTKTDSLQALIAELGERVEYLGQLEISVDECGSGHVQVSVPAADHFVDDATGFFQGGVTATLIDVVGGLAIRSTYDSVSEPSLVTTNLHVSYLKPASGRLRVEGDVSSVGSTLGTADVVVENADTREEAVTGLASYRIFE